MRHITRAAAAAAGLLFAVQAHGATPTPTTERAAVIDHGRELAQRNCAACHAIGPIGTSPFPAAPPFRELGRKYPLEDLQEALAEGIVSGHPAMPQFQFTPTDVTDLIAYLKSIQSPAPSRAVSPR